MGKRFHKLIKKNLRRVVIAVRKINDELDGNTGRAPAGKLSLPPANYLHHDVYEDKFALLFSYNRTDWFSNKRAKLTFDDYGMALKCNPGEMVYASYRENNCSYRMPGTGGFELPEGRYLVNFQAKVAPGVGGRLLIHGYTKAGDKVELLRAQINEPGELEINSTCHSLRLSMQLWGTGRMQFSEISFLKTDAMSSASAPAVSQTFPESFEGALWFTSNSGVNLEEEEISVPSEIGSTFLSYNEQNCKFSIPPQFSLTFPYQRTRVSFSGSVTGNLDAMLTLIGFVADEKQFVWQVPLNDEVEFMIPPEHQFRMALQVKGQGTLQDIRFGFEEVLAPKRALIEKIRCNADKIQTPPDRYEKNTQYKIGVIFDEFTFQCFQNEASYVVLDPDMYESQLEEEKVDFVLVESAWHGNGDKWNKMIADRDEDEMQVLPGLLAYCRAHGIKTAFWNKEDPVNYEHFIDSARLFDFVFTTDEGIIPQYQKDCGHSRVFALPFAANPAIHNPIGRSRCRIGEVAFAGSWMAHKHPDRMMDMIRVLKPAVQHDLCIFDRNYDKAVNNNYRFPLPYRNFIAGSLPFELMSQAYRMFDIFLNVNSVQKSPTMFSRRVFELLASGTAIVSGYSEGIHQLLPGLVALSNSEEETEAALSLLLHSPELRRHVALRGIREVMLSHTYRHRFQTILSCMGLPNSAVPEPSATFVGAAGTKEEADRILAAYAGQSLKKKQLILIYSGRIAAQQDILALDPANYSSQQLADRAEYENVVFLDPDCYYAPHFAVDLLASKVYSGAGVLGKSAVFCYNDREDQIQLMNCEAEYSYTTALDPGTMLVEKILLVMASIPLQDGKHFDFSDFLKVMQEESYASSFSADRYNFCRISGARAFHPAMDAVAAYGGDYEHYVTA